MGVTLKVLPSMQVFVMHLYSTQQKTPKTELFVVSLRISMDGTLYILMEKSRIFISWMMAHMNGQQIWMLGVRVLKSTSETVKVFRYTKGMYTSCQRRNIKCSYCIRI